MKRLFSLCILAALICPLPLGTSAQNLNKLLRAPRPVADANGFVSVLNSPRTAKHLDVAAERDDDGRINVRFYCDGKLIDQAKCEATSCDVRFLDGNFDGYTDVLVGPADSRNYSALFLWDPKYKRFLGTTTQDRLNGRFLMHPATRTWISSGSSSYCSMYYSVFRWDDDRQAVTESVIEITDPKAYHEYGVRSRYTRIRGGDFENIAAKRLQEARSLKALPRVWQKRIKALANAL